jgi:hypothetical protein
VARAARLVREETVATWEALATAIGHVLANAALRGRKGKLTMAVLAVGGGISTPGPLVEEMMREEIVHRQITQLPLRRGRARAARHPPGASTTRCHRPRESKRR